MKRVINKYHVFYVETCIPKKKSFKTKKQLQSFLQSFEKKFRTNQWDNWIDAVLHGKLLVINPDYTLKNKPQYKGYL